MNVDVKAVHYNLSDNTREFINKKVEKLEYLDELIIDFALTVTKQKNDYRVDAHVHYRWNKDVHFHTEERELYKAIELLIDKVIISATKEKEKIKEHAKGTIPQ